MNFDRIIGQQRVKDILGRAIEHQRVPHAYLFNGPEGVGKEALAIEFAKALYCSNKEQQPCNTCSNCKRVTHFEHPDFQFIFPAPKTASTAEERQVLDSLANNPYARYKPWASPTIGIDKIRELRHVSNLKPMEGKRIVIITEAHNMTAEAANSLLKILEEPPGFMHLILITSRLNTLLPTIISRCQEIRFNILSDKEIEQALIDREQLDGQKAEVISRMSQGSYGRALLWLDEKFDASRELSLEFLRVCLKSPMNQFELIDQLMQKYDKKVIKDILSLVMIWFRDSMYYLNGDENIKKYIVNVDKIDTLHKFVNTFEQIDFEKIFQKVENSIQLLDKNVQLNLLLYVLLTHLQDSLYIKGKTQ
ncbi:DNA polymerase III subunit delta' [candidate division KSB1 bacterium]|nr:DNA polymerase III subunit delta' [candidate division KSB1 bacterium]